eukprot:13662292-Alexandrium_andersonii.AAC.1
MTQSKSSTDTYTVAAAAQRLRDLGYPELHLRGDAEPGLQDMLRAIKRKAGMDMFVQSAPVGSHQSIGAAEQCHQVVCGRARTLISEVGHRYGVDAVSYTHLTLPTICSV